MTARLARAVLHALDTIPETVLEQYAETLATNRPSALPSGMTEVRAAAATLPGPVAAAFIRGVLAGHRHERDTMRVEAVWGGPKTGTVPVRSTARALTGLIDHARRELLLTTYSARPYPPIIEALREARDRGVGIDIVVETLSGAGTALSGAEPAVAFERIPGLRLWHWPTSRRPNPIAKLHAKLAIADRTAMLVSSVNLTESGVAHNIEAGVVIRGGHAPRRFAEHIARLCTDGTLQRLS